MFFMVIEHFKGGNPRPAGERFAREGRILPEKVVYHGSWLDPANARCFQVMEAEKRDALQPWIAAWSDLVDFEIVPVMPSREYCAGIGTEG